MARYIYLYRTVLVRASRFGAWGLTTNSGNSPPIQKGALTVMQRCLITASRRTVNASKCRELRTWKQSPLDCDHVLILTASLTWTDKVLRTQLFAKWSFVLVYPTSLIRHKSKYSIIFPYLRCNVSECETIIYYAKYRLILQSRSNGDTEACHHILICWEAPVCIYIYIYIYV